MRSPDRDCQGGQARLAVIGSKAVGKTALTVRYLTKRFIGEYQSDTDMIYRATMPVDGAKIALEILDLSSNLDEVVVPRETVAWAEAWLVVYSITSLESFRVCVRAVEAVTTACGADQPNPPVLIMANKKDLEHIREVPEAEGRKLAEQYGCRFVEVSAAEMVSQRWMKLDAVNLNHYNKNLMTKVTSQALVPQCNQMSGIYIYQPMMTDNGIGEENRKLRFRG